MKKAILGKCSDCCCGYIDGRKDCEIINCPLYPYMPYGKAWKNRIKKPRTEKQKAVTKQFGFKKKDKQL